MEPCVPLPLKPKTLEYVAELSEEMAVARGICMRPRNVDSGLYTYLPHTLLPSAFPRDCFEYAKSIQKDINIVIHRVAHDYDFLKKCLKSTVEVDEFTAKIFDIYETVRKEGLQQELSLGLLRSDYFLHKSFPMSPYEIKQIEINTISTSFGGLSSILSKHQIYTMKILQPNFKEDHIPTNRTDEQLAAGLVAAWKAYGKSEAVILVIVEEVTYNICDQHSLELAISNQAAKATVLRRRFSELTESVLRNGSLIVDGHEVAVAYYRTAYTPYLMTEEWWKIILLIERSKAIKCPSVHYHLAGTKKVQQELSQPGVLEKYAETTDSADRIRKTFVGLYTLELNEDGDRAVKNALANPRSYVLKPQREGGGNNIYGDDVAAKLRVIGNSKSREGYILMDLIKPPPVKNYILRKGHPPELCDVISELGIFGVILGDANSVITNYKAGHILRTKRMDVSEGGIAAGFGCLDTPYLF